MHSVGHDSSSIVFWSRRLSWRLQHGRQFPARARAGIAPRRREVKGSLFCELFLREVCDPKSCNFLHTAKNRTLSEVANGCILPLLSTMTGRAPVIFISL